MPHLKLKCSVCDNKVCFINSYCSSKWHSLIAEEGTCNDYKKGMHIFHEGVLATGIFFLYSGRVKIFNSGIKGKEQIVRLAKSGDILGHRGYGGKIYTISAVALENSAVCFINKDIFFQALKANQELTFNMMLFFANALRKAEIRLNNMAQMNGTQKIADALLFIKKAFGTSGKGKLVLSQITRQDIAKVAGTSVEQAIRELTCFEQKKLIAKDERRLIILDEQGLITIANPADTAGAKA